MTDAIADLTYTIASLDPDELELSEHLLENPKRVVARCYYRGVKINLVTFISQEFSEDKPLLEYFLNSELLAWGKDHWPPPNGTMLKSGLEWIEIPHD